MLDEPPTRHTILSLLFVGVSAALARSVQDACACDSDREIDCRLERVAHVSRALERLRGSSFAAVLIELHRPQLYTTLRTLQRLHGAVPQVPVIVLGDERGEEVTAHVLENGADEYLFTDELNHQSLMRAVSNAIRVKTGSDEFFLETDLAPVILNAIGEAVVSLDLSGRVTYLNRAARRLTGRPGAQALGMEFKEAFSFLDGRTREPVTHPIEAARQSRPSPGWAQACVLVRPDGTELPIEDSTSPIHDRAGNLSGAVIVFSDLSESRAMAQRMAYLAQHDYLTDLPNRMLLNERLSQCITLATRHERRLAILFLDLDHFKHINDSLGHSIGDELLKEVAQRLTRCVRQSDTVSRQGGDEFVVLLSEIDVAQDAATAAENIRQTLNEPYRIGGHPLHLAASIGISLFPEDGRNGETLFKKADSAMYHAKASGRNNSQFFEEEMNVRATQRQSIEGALNHAISRHEFVLHYQPTVNLQTGAVTGAEALIRWHHPERGLVAPGLFIGIAEESGLIEPIGKWVLREACRQARAWLDAKLPFQKIAVNISAAEFNNKAFLSNVCAILEETGLDPGFLEIELTETAVMRNVAATSHVLEALSRLGVRFAMDDFGTGYSSLTYLMRFPIDTLKIDRSFVQDIVANENAATIVSAVINLGHSLALHVVAEGVETAAQLDFLQARGCGGGQGFYFGSPAGADQFREILEAGLAV